MVFQAFLIYDELLIKNCGFQPVKYSNLFIVFSCLDFYYRRFFFYRFFFRLFYRSAKDLLNTNELFFEFIEHNKRLASSLRNNIKKIFIYSAFMGCCDRSK